MRINHNVSGCKCEVCGKRFARENDLKTHLWTHAKGKPYQCDLCDRTFTRASRRNNHRNEKHKDGLPTPSGSKGDESSTGSTSSSGDEDEPSSSKKKSQLKKRKRVKKGGEGKKGNVPQCKICQKKFASADRLKAHLKVHSKKKLYPCELCDRTFSQIGSRNRHRRGMHKGQIPPEEEEENLSSDEEAETFLCDLCDSSFTSEQYLEDHFLWIHNKNATRNGDEDSSPSPQPSPKRQRVEPPKRKQRK